MDFLITSVDFFRHLDVHLETLMREYELTTYLILAGIVFCETGLVVTPFLPGDSLLFAAGAITAKTGILDIWVLILTLMAAAILGDNLNYFLGRLLGKKVFDRDVWFLRKSYLQRTQRFYEHHGGKTILLARFVPILRTFAPFVAGVGAMQYPRFISYSVVASILWVPTFALSGYYFGQLSFVQDNFHWIMVAIIAISIVPIAIEWYRRDRGKPSALESASTAGPADEQRK